MTDMSSLDACKQQYEVDLARQTQCGMLTNITAAHREANRRVFDKLLSMQKELDAKGQLPYIPDTTSTAKKAAKGVHQTSVYPENLVVSNYRQLKQILPIPDVHSISDCDLIYRFLIARRMNEALTVQDIVHYIAFRDKYNLNHILWDPELEAMFNGLDGEELLRELINTMAKKGKLHGKGIVPVSRPLLQPGLAGWNCGVDRQGHVVFYQRPVPRDLAMLVRHWPHVEGEYDCRDPDFFSHTRPYSNLLVRLYLRNLEKGRRISRLLERDQHHIVHDELHIQPQPGTSPGSRAATRQQSATTPVTPQSLATAVEEVGGGGVTCLTDVGAVKVSHLTSSKYRDAFRLFRLVTHFGQVYYPENLSRFIIINGGFVFRMVYKLVRPWLDPQTQKKIILLSEKNKVRVEELNDAVSPSADVAESGSGEGDESDEETNGQAEVGTSNLALHKALLEYIDDRFIPSLYGGKLQVQPAPLFYGGMMPKTFSNMPHIDEACARISTKVLPELLPDEFVLRNCKAGKPIDEEEWQMFAESMRKRFR